MGWQGLKKRTAVAAAVAVLGPVAGTALGIDMAAAAVPAAQDTSAFCINVPSGKSGFTDISSSIHRRTIECLAQSGVTEGVTETTFNPSGKVTRGQMASFIARAIDEVNDLETVELPDLPASAPDKFTDDAGSVHETNINRLAAAGVVSGKTATTFAPNDIVTRAQMATFINNAQKFLSSGQSPFTSNQDYFVDDEGNVHEPNINGIASVGVTAGIDATHYGPSLPVLRANMATFITRYLAVLHKAGVIKPLPAAVPSNATIAFAPTTAARVTAAAEPSSSDEKAYTASGLDARPYRVTLVQSSLVTIDPGPVYSFTEDGNTGLADAGTVGAQIVAVNGLPITPAQSVGGISPVNGSIQVTIDAVSYGKLLPVIYTDEGGADNTRLNLDAQNRPSEPFGVAGELETIPERASSGVLGADATVLMSDEAADLISASILGTERSYLYDSNDTFYRDSVSVANQLTITEFEAALSKGDRLDATTAYQANPALPSTFVLENVSPAAPAATVATPVGERSAVINFTDLLPGATANVYLGADGAAFSASTIKASSAVDANPTEPGFQVNLTGLQPATSYEFYATQTSEGEESAPNFTVAGPGTGFTTTAEVPPTVTAANVNGGRPGSQLLLDFSEPVTLVGTPSVAAAKVTVQCKTILGLITTYSGQGTDVAAVDGDTLSVGLSASMPAPDGLSTCTAAVGAGMVQDASNLQNAAQSGINVP